MVGVQALIFRLLAETISPPEVTLQLFRGRDFIVVVLAVVVVSCVSWIVVVIVNWIMSVLAFIISELT